MTELEKMGLGWQEWTVVDAGCGHGEGDGVVNVELPSPGPGQVFAMDDFASAGTRPGVEKRDSLLGLGDLCSCSEVEMDLLSRSPPQEDYKEEDVKAADDALHRDDFGSRSVLSLEVASP